MPPINNVVRLLESRKIPHKVFNLPKEKLSALETAQHLGISPDIVYKTIVVTRVVKGKPILAIVPGPYSVDLKALAKVVGEKKVVFPTQREAENLTGLRAGSISPIALINRGFQIVFDDSALNHNEIHISGGELGLNVRISPEKLIKLTNAKLAQISKKA